MLKSFFSRKHVLLVAITSLISMFLLVKSVNIAVGTAGDPSDFWYYYIPGGFTWVISRALILHAESIKNNESSSNSKDPKKSKELKKDLAVSVIAFLVFCIGVPFIFFFA